MELARSRENTQNEDPDGMDHISQNIRMENQPAHTAAAVSKETTDRHTAEDVSLKISSNTVNRPLTNQDSDQESDQQTNCNPVSGTIQSSSRHPVDNENGDLITPDAPAQHVGHLQSVTAIKENSQDGISVVTIQDSSSIDAVDNVSWSMDKKTNERSAKNISLSKDSQTESQENEDKAAHLGEVASPPTGEVIKSPEQAFLKQLGLRKIDKKQKQAHVKSVGDISAKGSHVSENKQQACGSTLIVAKDCSSHSEAMSDKSLQSKHAVVEQSVSKLSMIKSLKVIKPVSDDGSTKEDKMVINIEAHGSSNGDQDTSSAKNGPVCIKVRLEENDITIICCPVALLLQHKGCVDVSLRENDPDAYSIKCQKCVHEEADPYAMLKHLKAEHRVQGCLQKLLNLNSQHLGCMSRPVCVNVPGVLTLPEKLSDMEQGVIRFNSSGVPRLSFVCRLCPLNFHTARGLSAHHQYFMRNLFTGDHPVSHESNWVCKLCPRQFVNFQSYYAHHKWMRVEKDLFVNTDAVNKKTKKFEVIDVSGKVVASLEVPKAHNLAVRTWPEEDSDIGWGYKASPERLTLNRSVPRDSEGSVQVLDLTSQTLHTDSVTADAIPEPAAQGCSRQPTLYRTLDNLCRKLAQRVDPSADTHCKINPAGDKEDDEHEYMCAICHKTFPRLPQMQGHMGSHVRKHRVVINQWTTIVRTVSDPPCAEQQSAVPEDVVYKCGVCSEVFPKLSEMQTHMECHNRLLPATKTSMKSLDTPFSETVKLMSFTCDLCHWSCSSERNYWDHRRTHDNRKKAEKDLTHRAVTTPESSSNVPIKTMYVCFVCNKSFVREINLKFHMKKHKHTYQEQRGEGQKKPDKVGQGESEQQYVCSTCGRSFSTSRQLTSHKTWHTKIRNRAESPPVTKKDNPGSPKRYYACSTCNKLCSSLWGLGLHKKKHLRSPKLRKCRVSSSKEREKVKRKVAERTCREKKGQTSGGKGKGNLPKQKIQASEFFCKYCQQHFSSSRRFANHVIRHTNVDTAKNQKSASSTSSKEGYSESDQVSKQTLEEKEVSTLKDGNDSSSSKVSTNVKPVPRHCSAKLQGRAISQKIDDGGLTDSALEQGIDAKTDTNQSVSGDIQKNGKVGMQFIEEKQQVNIDVNNDCQTARSQTDSNRNESPKMCHSSAEMGISQPARSTDTKDVINEVTSDTDETFVRQVSNFSKTTTTETEMHQPKRLTSVCEQATTKPTESINTLKDAGERDSPSQTQLESGMTSTADEKSMQSTTKSKAKEDISVDIYAAASHDVCAACDYMYTSSVDTNHDCRNKKVVPSENKVQITAPRCKETHSYEDLPKQGSVQPSPRPTYELEERGADILAKTTETMTLSNNANTEVTEQMRSSRDLNRDKVTGHPGHEVGPGGIAKVPETKKVASESSVDLTCYQADSESNVEVMKVSTPSNQKSFTPKTEVCACSNEALVEEGNHPESKTESNALSQKDSQIPQMPDTEKTTHFAISDTMSITKEISNEARQISSDELVLQNGKAQWQPTGDGTLEEHKQTSLLPVVCVSSNPLNFDAEKEITPDVHRESPPETKSSPQEGDNVVAQADCEQAAASNKSVTKKVNQVPLDTCGSMESDCPSNSAEPAIGDKQLGVGSDEPSVNADDSPRKLAFRFRFACEICNKTFNKKFQLRGHKGKHGKNGEGMLRCPATSRETSEPIRDSPKKNMIEPNVQVGLGECHETQQGNGEHSQSKDEQYSIQKQIGVACTANIPIQDETGCNDSPSEMQSTNSTAEKSQDDVTVTKSPSDKDSFNMPKMLKGKKLQCLYCKRTFVHVNQLNAHKKLHTYIEAKKSQLRKKSIMGKKSLACDICNKTFKDYRRLSCHRRVHVSCGPAGVKNHGKSGGKHSRAGQEGTSTRAASRECQRMRSEVLKPRLAKKSRQQGNFVCKFCNKSFYHLFRYKEHLTNIHPTAKTKLFFLKPFVCEVCGKAFSKSKQRTYHMKLHGQSGCQNITKMSLQDTDHSYYKKPPVAKTGGIPTEGGEKRKENLIHTSNDGASVLEYKCQFCEKFFKSQNQLAGHMNFHKKYTCQVCGTSFALARQLWGHLKIHGGLRKGLIDSGKQSGSPDVSGITSRPVTRRVTTNNSNALLKKIIRMYLLGARPTKGRVKKVPLSNGFQPKCTFQRALLKHQQARMQKMFGILRKSVILEIDADSHRLVYDCKECHKISVSHKVILHHFLAKHLEQTKEPVAAGTEKGDKTPPADQRFRSKSKVGCPVCKSSSGFQCHLHNTDEFADAKLPEGHFARDDSSESKLVQENLRFSKHTPSYRFKCTLCPFTSKSEAGLISHQKFHQEKSWKQLITAVQPGKKSLGCPWCSFKAKNVYALAAHSRVHRAKNKGKKVLLGKGQNPKMEAQGLNQTQGLTPRPGQSPFPCPMSRSETSLSPSLNNKGLSDSAHQQKHAYICCICSKSFQSTGAYRVHLKKHTESFPFKCSQCPCRFPSADGLHKHIMSVHSAKNPYRCTECPFSSANREALLSHLQIHSGAREKKDRKAGWSAYLSQVLQTRVAGTDVADSDDGLNTAESMPETLSHHDDEALSSARLQTFNPKPGESLTNPIVAEPEADLTYPEQTEGSSLRLSDSPSEYFACSQCKNFQASSKEEWDEHMTLVHKECAKTKLKCTMCKYKTTSKEHLQQHMKHHSHQTLQCNSCTYSTPHRHLMVRHVQTVHRQHRPFKCMQCTYSTAYRHHLKRHSEKHKDPNFRCRYRKLMKKGDWHSAEVPTSSGTNVICRECGRQLQNKKTLRNHYIRVHGKRLGVSKFTGFSVFRWEEDVSGQKKPTIPVVPQNGEAASNEKMFECTVCSYSFKCRSELNQHLAEGHLETRSSIPCQCPQCGLVTGSGQLKAHMVIHQEENLLQCPENGCNFQTAKNVHLDHHLIKHATQRKTQIHCQFCQTTFPDTSSLRMHNIQNHSDQSSSINARSPFKCPQCPYVSPNQKDASRHFSLHNYNLAFKCEYCLFSTSTAAAIATHRKIHRHPRCSLSSVPSSTAASQSPKVKSNSPAKSAGAQDSPGRIREQTLPKHIFVTDSGKKLYECRYCQRFFDVAEAWQRHEVRHRIEWPPC